MKNKGFKTNHKENFFIIVLGGYVSTFLYFFLIMFYCHPVGDSEVGHESKKIENPKNKFK